MQVYLANKASGGGTMSSYDCYVPKKSWQNPEPQPEGVNKSRWSDPIGQTDEHVIDAFNRSKHAATSSNPPRFCFA